MSRKATLKSYPIESPNEMSFTVSKLNA
jgi:hypothetical protein